MRAAAVRCAPAHRCLRAPRSLLSACTPLTAVGVRPAHSRPCAPAHGLRGLSARPVSLCGVSSHLTDPEQLKELLGIPFTPEQTACITAPPAPQVIVAGAGSGKTTVMAARVVWLVGTGQVAPEQVLGLTFTNKAAA